MAVLAVAAGAAGAVTRAQPPLPEVRQIVTFDLEPGATPIVIGLYLRHLLPVYQDLQPLRRFRAYTEAESPESLDFVVVSSYRGMAGMDAANDLLRATPREGPSPLAIYGQIDRSARGHHDQFVEMLESVSDPSSAEVSGEPRQLTVFEYIRLTPGTHAFFEELLALRIRPFEQDQVLYRWSETGRVIVGDGWDYVRFYGVDSLGAWHDYLRAVREADFQQALSPIVLARKTIILRREPTLSVR